MDEAWLDEHDMLRSDLWVDQPDARTELARRVSEGRIAAEDEEPLADFIEEGYCVVDLDIPPAVFDAIDRDIDAFWAHPPAGLAWGGTVRGVTGDFDFRSVAPLIDREIHRQYRFVCAHSHSDALLELYLNARIHRLMRSIFGQPCLATQTLYFEYGSSQGLHRDTCVVTFDPPAHLAASWIALEDVAPESGPLVYVPGSHRLPHFRFGDGALVYDLTEHGDEGFEEMDDYLRRQAQEAGLSVERFAPKRGQALLWHAGLVHGGAPIEDLTRTRRSLVTHFTTEAATTGCYHRLHHRARLSGGFRQQILRSHVALEHEGAVGYESALVAGRGVVASRVADLRVAGGVRAAGGIRERRSASERIARRHSGHRRFRRLREWAWRRYPHGMRRLRDRLQSRDGGEG